MGKSSIPEIKNSLRPFFNRSAKSFANAKKPVKRWTSFNTIRNAVQASEIGAMYTLVERQRYYDFDGLGNSFPRDRSQIPDTALIRLEPLTASRELALQVGRLNHYASELSAALDALDDISRSMEASDWSLAEQRIERYYEDYGYSTTIVKKDLLCAYEREGLLGLSRRFKALTEGFEGTAWRLLCAFTHEMVDPAYHPSRATKSWLAGLPRDTRRTNWYSAPLAWEVVGLFGGDNFTALQALRYNSISLIDLALFIWTVTCIEPNNTVLTKAVSGLDGRLRETLHGRFSAIKLPVPHRYSDREHQVEDHNLFRATFFFSEYANIAVSRAQVAELLFADADNNDPTSVKDSPLRSPAIRLAVLEDSDSGRELEAWRSTALSEEWSGQVPFLTSLVAADVLRSSGQSTPLEEHQLVRLLTKTRDVQDYISVAELVSLAERAEDREMPLAAYLFRDLAFKRRRTQDHDLERRAAFMAIFDVEGRAGIQPYISALNAQTPEAAEYIFNACSRIFLERLYLLMSSVKDVIETRIELCNWYIETRTDPATSVQEERRALCDELANLDARSDLDSTRVHVDEEALREWYSDTQYSRVARFIQTVVAGGAATEQTSFLSFYNKLLDGPTELEVSDEFFLSTQIGPQFVLLQIVEDTLKAFTSDKTFGMDAYLSRRIRHGTLSGFLITPVTRVLHRLNDELTGASASGALMDVKDVIEQWRAWVITQIDFMRRELIQIRSDKHPDALMDPTWRVPSGVTYLDAMISSTLPEVVRKGHGYDLFSDVHALCWDLVERDLAKVRLFLLRDFATAAADKLTELYGSQPYEHYVTAYPYLLDAQHSLIKRIHEVCGWFIRPVRRKDSYDLRTLIASMTSIVRELDASYDFVETISLNSNIRINRGTFEVLGDVLFVLIGNAAKHGKRGGEVSVEAIGDNNADQLTVSVTSQMATSEEHDYAVGRIESALRFQNTADLEAASVQEGFSGIRKLLGLLHRVRLDGQRWQFSADPQTLTLTFNVRVPQQIHFKQERA